VRHYLDIEVDFLGSPVSPPDGLSADDQSCCHWQPIPNVTALDISAINRQRRRAMRGANVSVAVPSGP